MMEKDASSLTFITASDIKQYFYCPRIVYFNYLVPDFKPATYKMKEGKIRQEEETRLEKRRTLIRFGLRSKGKEDAIDETTAEKFFNVKLISSRLKLSGIVDMAIIVGNEVIPVDFKDGSFSVGYTVHLHHKYQLLFYGLLLEDTYRKRTKRGFIHSLENGTTKQVYFTEGARMYLAGKIRKIRQMPEKEVMPDETPYRGRCKECEYRPICQG
jgi:CRISPR-associated exonuclease Cas4